MRIEIVIIAITLSASLAQAQSLRRQPADEARALAAAAIVPSATPVVLEAMPAATPAREPESFVLPLPSAVLSQPELGRFVQDQKAPEEPKWTGSFKVGAGISSGNTDRRNVGASFDAEYRRPEDRITVDAAWDYAEDKPTGQTRWNLTQRRAGAGAKYDRFINKELYYLLTGRLLGDTLADLKLRYTVGAGLGYQIIDTKETSLNGEAGVSYFNEDFRTPGVESVDYIAARVAYKLRHAFNDKTRLIHGVEAYPSLEKPDDVYFQATTEVQTNLSTSMIAALTWVWDWDNTPSPGRDRSDHRVLLTVGWTF